MLQEATTTKKTAVGSHNAYSDSKSAATMFLKPVTKVVLLKDDGDGCVKFKCAESNTIFIRAIDEGKHVWLSLDSEGNPSPLTDDKEESFVLTSSDRNTLSLDEIAYMLAEWVCLRNTFVTKKITIACWAKLNGVDLTNNDINYIQSLYPRYIKSH